MDSSRNILILAAAFSCFFLHVSISSQASSDSSTITPQVVHQFCQGKQSSVMFNRTFCEEVLRDAKAKNLKELALFALEKAINCTAKDRSDINRLYWKEINPKVKPNLKICVEEYASAIGSFRSAHGEVRKGDCLTANYDCFTIHDNTDRCTLGLKTSGAKLDPFVSTTLSNLTQFGNINYALTDTLGAEC